MDEMERRTQLARRFYRRRRVSSPVTGQLADTVLEISAVRRPVRVCCGSRWGRCVLFFNILDSLQPLAWCIIRPCIQYTAGVASMAGAYVHTLAGVAGAAGVTGPVLQTPTFYHLILFPFKDSYANHIQSTCLYIVLSNSTQNSCFSRP